MDKTNSVGAYTKKFGMTLEQVSEISGISTRTLSNWHSGDKPRPKALKAMVVGCYFIKRLDYFIEQLTNLKEKTDD